MDSLALAAYSLVLLLTIPRHEPWYDEAQAWLIARDCSLPELFLRQLHYEGTPGLWHALLWMLIRIGVPYGGVQWLAGALAVGGIYILLRFSPFPPAIRLLIPFTFYLQYQYAVIARSYVLFPALAFLLCAMFANKKPRLVCFCAIAGVLANLCLYGTFFAAGIVFAYIRELRMKAKEPQACGNGSPRTAAALCLFALMASFGLYTAIPAPNATSGPAAELSSRAWAQNVLAKVTMIPVNGFQSHPVSGPKGVGRASSSGTEPSGPAIHPSAGARLVMARVMQKAAKFFFGTDGLELARKCMLPLALLTYPVATSNILACVFLLLLFWMLLRQHRLHVLAPYAGVLFLSVSVRAEAHHTGLLWISLLTAMWLAWPRQAKRSFLFAFILVLVLQAGWSFHAVSSDIRNPYDGDLAAANFLAGHLRNKTIAGLGSLSAAVEPYFPEKIYFNHPASYWEESTNNVVDRASLIRTIHEHPDYIVAPEVYYGDQRVPDQWISTVPAGEASPRREPFSAWMRDVVLGHGYRETHRFCGNTFMRNGSSLMMCQVIMEPSGPQELAMLGK